MPFPCRERCRALLGLRDTHPRLCAQAGVPVNVVSLRLGHASIGVPSTLSPPPEPNADHMRDPKSSDLKGIDAADCWHYKRTSSPYELLEEAVRVQ